MKLSSIRAAAVAVVLICQPRAPLLAQQHGLELGADAALYVYSYSVHNSVGGNVPSRTVVSFPLSSVRLGFRMGGPVQLEPAVGFLYSGSGGQSSLSLSTELGFLIPVTNRDDEKQSQIYIRPAVGLDYVSSSQFSSTRRLILGAGVGIRAPLTDQIAARYEVRVAHLGELADVSANVIGLRVGLSVFMPR